MKGKKEDKMLRELFRQKLEEAEVFPSAAVRVDLFRRVVRKEFLKFNPARFNIWYAGAIFAAGAAAVLILFLNDGNIEETVPREFVNPETEIKEEFTGDIKTYEEKTGTVNYSDNKKGEFNISEISAEQEITESIIDDTSDYVPDIPLPAEINAPFSENNVLPDRDTDSGKLRLAKQTSEIIRASVTSGCCPLKVAFEAVSGLCDHYNWTFGDGGTSNDMNPEWIYDVEGEYKVSLQIYDSVDLRSEASCIITVFPKPVARFDIISGNANMPDQKVSFANYSTNAVDFRWYFGDGNSSDLYEPVHIYKESGNYDISLIVISAQGCSDTLTVTNAFTTSGNYIKFPNAFFPNLNGPSGGYYSAFSDDAANVFHPVSSGVSECQLRVFSKTGVLIFESNDINIGWDGYYKGQLCQSGVYIWKVRGKFINGEPFTKMGDLTLLKN